MDSFEQARRVATLECALMDFEERFDRFFAKKQKLEAEFLAELWPWVKRLNRGGIDLPKTQDDLDEHRQTMDADGFPQTNLDAMIALIQFVLDDRISEATKEAA